MTTPAGAAAAAAAHLQANARTLIPQLPEGPPAGRPQPGRISAMLDVQSDDVIQNLLDRIGIQFKGVDWKIDFVADRLTPLLEELTAEFLMKEPENLLLHGSVWLAEKAKAPEELMKDPKRSSKSAGSI